MSIDKISIEQISALQLSDSFFPTGMYTTSNGLEALFYKKQRKLNNPVELLEMIKVYLECQIGPADCTALGNSYDCTKRQDLSALVEIDRMVFSMKLIRDIREASARSGSQLIRCLVSFIKKYRWNCNALQFYCQYGRGCAQVRHVTALRRPENYSRIKTIHFEDSGK